MIKVMKFILIFFGLLAGGCHFLKNRPMDHRSIGQLIWASPQRQASPDFILTPILQRLIFRIA